MLIAGRKNGILEGMSRGEVSFLLRANANERNDYKESAVRLK
ncbi:hypothetical protein ASZ90_005971 [hydrocarbon metagenome]|uniref:Uncharacterized protein n=1 Tax=hydrocarbon metagenome TaxID=938273 RepID=A0A0W8FTP9_9ZZZZ